MKCKFPHHKQKQVLKKLNKMFFLILDNFV